MCSGSPAPTVHKPYVSDDEGNVYREILGPYRGSQPAFFNNDSPIFQQDSTTPLKGMGLLTGALSSHGALGTLGAGSFLHGTTQLIVYGDQKTGKPSSWSLFEWLPNGKEEPNSGAKLYEWKRSPNARSALATKGFYESYSNFSKTNGSDRGSEKK
jgi:hypothetical protein